MTVELEVNKIDTYFQKLFPGHDSFGIETDGFNYKTERFREIFITNFKNISFKILKKQKKG